ncbi:MAG: hypothetical protein IH944_11735 [Armatimonadetes bacterium]|nr:hypothetical protein [Armatimonadota bacterium]
MAFYISFLSTRPVVKVTPQLVTSRSPWLTHVLTLGSYSRNIAIDSRTRTVRIDIRYLWVGRRQHTVAFDQIAYITYECLDHTLGGGFLSGEREGPEQFEVGLGLKSGKRLDLCTFTGEGEYVSDHAFFWQWPSHKIKELTDVAGTQQEESMSFVDLICYRIGVHLGP